MAHTLDEAVAIVESKGFSEIRERFKGELSLNVDSTKHFEWGWVFYVTGGEWKDDDGYGRAWIIMFDRFSGHFEFAGLSSFPIQFGEFGKRAISN